jgi:hypothetical protein
MSFGLHDALVASHIDDLITATGRPGRRSGRSRSPKVEARPARLRNWFGLVLIEVGLHVLTSRQPTQGQVT